MKVLGKERLNKEIDTLYLRCKNHSKRSPNLLPPSPLQIERHVRLLVSKLSGKEDNL